MNWFSLFITARPSASDHGHYNANLVVNTDADQIIIADAGPHRREACLQSTYVAGGVEDANIRKAVCDTLEAARRHSANVRDLFG